MNPLTKVLLIVSFLIVGKLTNNSFAQSNTLLPIAKDGKWGIINLEGDILIEPQFDFMPVFDKNGLATVFEYGKMGVIDSLGTNIISSKYDDLRIISRQHYLVSNDGMWGMIKNDESIVLPIQYSQILPLSSQYLLVKKDSLAGLSNFEGKLEVPIKFDNVTIANAPFYLVQSENKWGIYQRNEGVIQSTIYDNIESEADSIFLIEKDDKWGVYLPSVRKETIPVAFDSEEVLKEGFPYIIVTKKGLKGIYHKDGAEILSPSALDIHLLNKEKFAVHFKNNKWGIVDINGNWLVKPIWKKWSFINTNFLALENKYGNKALFSLAIDSLLTPASFTVFEYFNDDYLIARGGKTTALLTQNGRLVTIGQYVKYQSLGQGIHAAFDGLKWHLFNNNGEKLLSQGVEKVTKFLENPIVSQVSLNTKVGLIRPNGSWLLPAEFYRIKVFEDVIKAYGAGGVTLFYLDESGEISDRMTFNNVNIVKVNSIDLNEKIFEEGISSDSSAVRFTESTNSSGKVNYRPYKHGAFNNRWALWNSKEKVFKDLEKHKIMRFLYTFGKYKIQFGWAFPRGVKYDEEAQGKKLKIYPGKEQLNYVKTVFNRPKQLNIGYVGEFHEGRARVNIGGLFKSVGLNERTQKYALGQEAETLLTRKNKRRLEEMVGRTVTLADVEYTYVCSGGFWGFIDEKGELIIDFDYSYVSNFHEGVAIAEKKGKWGIIDKNNHQIIPFKYNFIDYLPGSDSTLFRLHSNQKLYGYVDSLGTQLVPTQFEALGDYKEGLAMAKQSGKWGFISREGEWVIPNQFEGLLDFSESMAAAKTNKQWGFINKNGEWLIEPQFREVGMFKEGIAPAKKGALTGYIDKQGNWLIEPQYQRGTSFNKGLAIAKKQGKFGLIDKEGNWVISPKFKKLEHHGNFYLAAKNAWGLINEDGTPITKFKYSSIDKFVNGYARVRHKGANYYKSKYGFIDSLGNEVIGTNYNSAGRVKDGLIRVKNLKEDWKYMNLNEEVLFTGDYENCTDFSEGKAVVFTEKGRLQGGKFISKTGKILFDDKGLDALTSFKQGRAVVRNAFGEMAYLDSLGQIVNNTFYQDVMPFTHKVSFVKKNDKWAVTSISNVPISQFIFDSVSPFKNGLSKVSVNIHYGIAKISGKLVVPPYFETVDSINKNILRVASADRVGYLKIDSGEWLWKLQN